MVATRATVARSAAVPPVHNVGDMRKAVEFCGLVLLAMGISGTIDHLGVQPLLGFLNVLNRWLFPKVVPGYELYANLTVALLGLVLLVAAARTRTA